MKRIPTFKQFSYNRINSFRNCNPYTIIFFYPKDDTPFVVKGGWNDCNKFIKKYKIPSILHITYWYHGEHRNLYNVINTKIKCYIYRNKYSYDLSINGKCLKTIKQVPRKWIKELNDFI